MKCLDYHESPTRISSHTTSALILFTFLVGTISVIGSDGIEIEGPRRIALPSLTVSADAQQVYSGTLTLDLSNAKETNGWLLQGDIAEDAMIGDFSGERIPAALTFRSITWIAGGNGSAAGVRIHSDGTRIEADPGFGIGKYKIEFEIKYDVPAFPATDSYNCVSTFIVQ